MALPPDLQRGVQQHWHDFLQRTEPARPDLLRYCLALTKSIWDAEDLVQETLLRAFAKLGDVSSGVENPKAYLLRTASNLWIDRVRKTREQRLNHEPIALDPQHSLEVRDATRQLLQSLSPQERVSSGNSDRWS